LQPFDYCYRRRGKSKGRRGREEKRYDGGRKSDRMERGKVI